jgi:hypothetical protein
MTPDVFTDEDLTDMSIIDQLRLYLNSQPRGDTLLTILSVRYKRLRRELDTLLENLTVTQTRCTALFQESRAFKWLNTSGPIESRIVADVVHERRMQDQKWGPIDEKQVDKPDGTGELWRHAALDLETAGHMTTRPGATQTWSEILMEEALEANVETDPVRLRAKLIQVAAVACKWVQVLDMRKTRVEARTEGIHLPGGWCQACGGFNGSAKETRVDCRACGARKP